jgi:capsular polysaccharide biosynthesis protein/GGDEF domain-containing protein
MELRRYLALIRRHRWLVLAVFLVTTGSSIWFVERAIPVYESTGSYIVRPVPNEDQPYETVDSIDTLIRGAQISATYAKIASSDLIGGAAKDTLAMRGIDTSGTRVAAEPVTGTNLLEITVSGPYPDAAQTLAVEIGTETIANIDRAGDPYELSKLDEPNRPGSPTSPKKTMTVAAAAVFGLMLGVGLALLIEYVAVPVPALAGAAAVGPALGHGTGPTPADDPLTGLSAERTLATRITQEVSRAQHHGDLFGFGVLKIAVAIDGDEGRSRLAADDDLRVIADAIRPTVRDEDVLARLGATTFAALLPGMDLEAAEWAVLEWEAVLAELAELDDGGTAQINVKTAVCEYRDDTFSGDRDAISVARRLIAGRGAGSPTPSTPSPSGERAER